MTDAEKYAQHQLEKAEKLFELAKKKRELKELEAIQRDFKKYNSKKQ